MLNGGLKSGKTNMFGPKEYVQIYTYVKVATLDAYFFFVHSRWNKGTIISLLFLFH